MAELLLEVKMFPDSFQEDLNELLILIRAYEKDPEVPGGKSRADKNVIEDAFSHIRTYYYDFEERDADFLNYSAQITMTNTAIVSSIKVTRRKKPLTRDDYKRVIDVISERCRYAIQSYIFHST